jgi:TRAP-type C4-dicarboxylate transport system permease small subunit
MGILTITMVAEVFFRYAFDSPLGWNVSLVEKFLLPGIVMLGLPWARANASHVSAGMVYERLPRGVQRLCTTVAEVIEVTCYLALLVAGVAIAWRMFEIGAEPPPLSSQVPLPSWVWRLFLPLGAAASILIVVSDALDARVRKDLS